VSLCVFVRRFISAMRHAASLASQLIPVQLHAAASGWNDPQMQPPGYNAAAPKHLTPNIQPMAAGSLTPLQLLWERATTAAAGTKRLPLLQVFTGRVLGQRTAGVRCAATCMRQAPMKHIRAAWQGATSASVRCGAGGCSGCGPPGSMPAANGVVRTITVPPRAPVLQMYNLRPWTATAVSSPGLATAAAGSKVGDRSRCHWGKLATCNDETSSVLACRGYTHSYDAARYVTHPSCTIHICIQPIP
jgi:hypothetical protein